jgi:hypothetical protein
MVGFVIKKNRRNTGKNTSMAFELYQKNDPINAELPKYPAIQLIQVLFANKIASPI